MNERDAIQRAKFFLDKARHCPADERADFEAYLEAAIVFTRAALHRLQARFKSHPAWKHWWDLLLSDPSVDFIREERNRILKEAPPKIGQVLYGGSQQPQYASAFYYYESAGIPATDTVNRHLNRIADLVAQGETRFA